LEILPNEFNWDYCFIKIRALQDLQAQRRQAGAGALPQQEIMLHLDKAVTAA
jgi:hypothetical protein